jgi:muramidase (phage lysozyme)
MEEILKNNLNQSIAKSSRFWAPMPGNSYNQPQTRIDELVRIYDKQLAFYKSFNFSYPTKKGRLWIKK